MNRGNMQASLMDDLEQYRREEEEAKELALVVEGLIKLGSWGEDPGYDAWEEEDNWRFYPPEPSEMPRPSVADYYERLWDDCGY